MYMYAQNKIFHSTLKCTHICHFRVKQIYIIDIFLVEFCDTECQEEPELLDDGEACGH